MNESCRAESIGPQNVFHKHPDRTRKCIQRIVKGHDTKWNQVRKESIDIFLGTLITVIAVNPQQADRPVPGSGHFCRVRTMRFHVI